MLRYVTFFTFLLKYLVRIVNRTGTGTILIETVLIETVLSGEFL